MSKVRRFVTTRRDIIKLAGAGATAAVVANVAGRTGVAFAQDATPAAGGPPLPEGVTLVASGFNGPRNLAIDTDGTIYVTEAGVGGDEPLYAPPAADATPDAAASPTPEVPLGSRGYTGQVSKIAPDGTVSVVASGIASYITDGPVGPAGIVLAGGKLWVAVGGAGPMTPIVEALETENSVLSIDPATGEITKVADIGAYEKANNPDPYAIDSDVYGMTLGADGLLYVADAGGNAIYTVDPATGEIALLAVIPGIELPADQMPPGGNPARGGKGEIDPVPTSVAIDADGTVYVGLLSGGPFPPGGAKIVEVGDDGSVTDDTLGLTMVTDVAFGPDGELYAVELSTNFLGATGPEAGQVVRINDDGTTETIVGGLFLPNGIAFDAEGNLFITAGTVTAGPPGTPPSGMVLRIDGVATPAA